MIVPRQPLTPATVPNWSIEDARARMDLVVRGDFVQDVFANGRGTTLLPKTRQLGWKKFCDRFGDPFNLRNKRDPFFLNQMPGAIPSLNLGFLNPAPYLVGMLISGLVHFSSGGTFTSGAICLGFSVLTFTASLNYFCSSIRAKKEAQFQADAAQFFEIQNLITQHPDIVGSALYEAISIIGQLCAYYQKFIQIQKITGIGEHEAKTVKTLEGVIIALEQLRNNYQQIIVDLKLYHTLLAMGVNSTSSFKVLQVRANEIRQRLSALQEVCPDYLQS